MIGLSKFDKAVSGGRERLLRPRNILMVIAGFELFAVLLDFLFGRMSILFPRPFEPAGRGIGIVLTKTYFACHPLLTIAALALAALGRVWPAIVALGVVEMTRWLNLTAWVLQNGLQFDDGLAIQWTAAQIFINPAIAAWGIALAVRGERLGLATALIGVPTLYNLVGFSVYALWVLINGV
jgi:hypothetical protein